jgi:selenocysteine lyase/cysteine desulfurase
MWQHLEPEIENVRRRLAKVFGVDAEEIAITRNASEALETCLLGIDLQPGDEVLTTNLDYPRMITTIQQRERRDGVKMVQVNMPAVPPASGSAWATRPLEEAITSKTKMILVSHVSFMNGLIFPIKEIRKLAKAKGIPLIVDGAHAFVQFPFQQADLDCEHYGVSLHKWLMAPVGTGMLYVKKEKIKELWPLMAATDKQAEDIRKYEEIGTHPAANHNAIGEALTFHEMLGGERKAARLRYLRSRWTDRLKDLPNVRFYTSLRPEHSCALTTVGVRGIPTADLHAYVYQKHGIYTTSIGTPGPVPEGPMLIDGLRVTPNVYTTVSEVDRFADAMVYAATKGIS